ncbi:hypothetical protein TNCV_420311 [Trichonephila clavipes]|uniref:Uncharacterized protein n=1 Tax=Trichonephila clavipes TaxID=2585209 RepID=A0A8X6V4S2_TRICX|nr:hypothetical protein TNCV_420311 [Trichonephila clavipes]
MLRVPHIAKALYIYKHRCLHRDFNPGPSAQQSTNRYTGWCNIAANFPPYSCELASSAGYGHHTFKDTCTLKNVVGLVLVIAPSTFDTMRKLSQPTFGCNLKLKTPISVIP